MFGEAKVINEELVEDVDPNLYVKRAEDFLKQGNYRQALKEIDSAINFGGNRIEYAYQKVKILFAIGEYKNCYDLIMSNIYKRRGELSDIQREDTYVLIAKCFKKCNMNPEQFEFIILVPNGEGMYNSIQEAINRTNKAIYLTKGTYNENIIINKDVNLESSYATIKTNNSNGIIINSGKVKISKLSLVCSSNNSVSHSITIKGGEVTLNDCSISNDCSCGIMIHTGASLIFNFTTIDVKETALKISSGVIVNTNNSKLKSTGGNVCVKNFGTLYANKSEFSSINVEKSCCIDLYEKSQCELNDCKVCDAEYGIYVYKDANCLLIDSSVHSSEYGIASEGSFEVRDSSIRINNIGIFVLDGVANLYNSDSSNNRGEGIFIKDMPFVNIYNCKFNGNNTGGWFKSGKIKVMDSKFYGNKLCGINNQSKNIKVYSSSVYDNGNSGVFSQEYGNINLSNCKIYCNSTANVAVAKNAVVSATDCSISSSSQAGVYAYDNGACILNGCDVYNNSGQGISTRNGGVVKQNNCSVRDNESIVGALSGVRRFFRGV